jgi:MerR family transcriptional regulator, light-induced transcriptional regulator
VTGMSEIDFKATYSIKAAAEATGLTVETLRAWERRYRVIEPKRGAGGHRLYSSNDITRLRRLRESIVRGHQIGKIAHLSDEALDGLLGEPQQQPDTGARALIDRILRAVAGYKPIECDQVMAMAFALLPPFDVVRDVLTPMLREVGERWHRGEFSVAQERIASYSARRHLGALLHTFNSVARGPGVVFTTLSGEQHELGALMYAALAASQRLRAYYLGPDLPPAEAGGFALKVGATAVAVSLVTEDTAESGMERIHVLRRHLPADKEIWVGGGAACRLGAGRLPVNSILMAELDDFEQRVRLLTATP